MAFKKNVTSVFGVEIQNAYHRIEGVSLMGKDKISFNLRAYVDAELFPCFSDRTFQCNYDLNGDNPIKQAYNHVKSLEEFINVEDC